MARPPEFGPARVRASLTLLNGSEELDDEEPTSHAGAGCSQAARGRSAAREGRTVPEVAETLEVSEATYHRWRNQFGGMKANDAKRLKELERENSQLKRIVADQVLENQR